MTVTIFCKDFTFGRKPVMCCAALLGACDVIQDGRHFGRVLGFYRKLEIVKKR